MALLQKANSKFPLNLLIISTRYQRAQSFTQIHTPTHVLPHPIFQKLKCNKMNKSQVMSDREVLRVRKDLSRARAGEARVVQEAEDQVCWLCE